MHDEILSPEQLRLLPLMKQFRREFCLVGGTAIALHLGHRRSIDFDMFKFSRLNHKKNLDKITALTGGGGVLAAFNLRQSNTSLIVFQRCCVEYAIDSGIVLS